MKKIFTLAVAACAITSMAVAQNPISCNSSNCIINSVIDQCGVGSPNIVSNFQDGVQKAGNPTGNGLSVNSVWRFTNVATVTGTQVDGEIKIVAISNAKLDNIDDDDAEDQSGNSIASFFAPRIGPDVSLNASSKRGYVEFQLTFYKHFTTAALNFVTIQAVTGLNFVHYDIDGHSSGTNGWFRELGDVKLISTGNPALSVLNGSELTQDLAAGTGWSGFYGSICERDGVSKCAQVAVAAQYTGAQSVLNFRMGYDYKAGSNEGNTVRQYGCRFGCFNFPASALLPVTIASLNANYKGGIANLNWLAMYESGMKGYEIERSVDGNFFSTIGFVGAYNQFSVARNYVYADDLTNVGANVIFYRLRMIDLDGKVKISNTISVRKDKLTSSGIQLVPNPASSNAQIKLSAVRAGRADILVTDQTGRLLLKQSANIYAGSNSISLNDVSSLQNAVYNVKLIVDDQVYTEKLVISR